MESAQAQVGQAKAGLKLRRVRVPEDLADLLPRVLAVGPHDPPLFGRYHYDEDDQLQIEWANTVT